MNSKRLGKNPNCGEIGAVLPINKKACKESVVNYRPVKSLYTVSNALQHYMSDFNCLETKNRIHTKRFKSEQLNILKPSKR